jgi:hypothetical protein
MKTISKGLMALALLSPAVANAATIVGPTTAVTGINDLSFQLSNGQTATYNITFVPGSYNSVYGANTEGTTAFWNDQTDALAAANSIFATLNNASVYGLIGPLNPSTNNTYLGFAIPQYQYPTNGILVDLIATDILFDNPSGPVCCYLEGDPGNLPVGNTGASNVAYVVFTPVPLPASAWLMLSGVAGFGAMIRRRPRVATGIAERSFS